MKNTLLLFAASLVAAAGFAANQPGEPGYVYDFKQVGEAIPGITAPGQVSGMRLIQPNDAGFGLTDYQFISIAASGFSPNGNNVSNIGLDGGKTYVSGNTIQYANVDLPQGAVIDGMTAYGNDNSTTDNVLFELRRFNTNPVSTSVVVASYSSSVAGTGDITQFVSAAANEFVDNFRRSYAVWVWNSSTVNNFRGVVIWFHRRMAPAPASARFVDVPTTHQFFQPIEALAASGVTIGCTDSTHFCPDQTVTRAQMAAFLARALGLHWPYTTVP